MENAETGPLAPKVAASKIKVEVAYARPDVQVIIPIEVAPGATVGDAIRASAIIERFSGDRYGHQSRGGVWQAQ